jgi:hypothetical protein
MEGTRGGAEWNFDFCGGLEGQGGGEQMGHGEGDVSEGGGGRGGGDCQGGGGKRSYGAWGLEDSEWRARLRDIYSELLQPVLLEGRLSNSGGVTTFLSSRSDFRVFAASPNPLALCNTPSIAPHTTQMKPNGIAADPTLSNRSQAQAQARARAQVATRTSFQGPCTTFGWAEIFPSTSASSAR